MLSYIGGKSKIGKWIVPFYDKDMETYVETFGGMFWCFFNMDLKQFPNLKKVVYNDFNPLNHNLFQCIKNPERLLESLNSISCQKFGEEITPSIYKEQFLNFQAEIFDKNFNLKAGNYEIAAKYAYVLTQVFSGSKPETSSFIDLKGKYKSKYLTFRDKLSKPDWVEHFLKNN
jgi:site-specific DNA-adenine methylase